MSAVPGERSQNELALEEWRLGTRVHDTFASSSVGGFLYLVAWFPMAYIARYQVRYPWALAGITLAFLLIAFVRWRMRPPSEPANAMRRWLNRYVAISLASPAIWAALQVWIINDPAIPPMDKSVSLFATVAFSTVFAHLYASTFRFSLAGNLILMVPPLVALWWFPDLRLLAIAMTFYAGYLTMAIVRAQADYHRRLDLAEALLEQRNGYQRLSRTDVLTGLCNRRVFSGTLYEQVREVLSGSDRVVSLILMDIDHFKSINDRYGHIIGDEALKRFALLLEEAFNTPGMLVARTGGEEFAVVATALDEAEAVKRADAFRIETAAEELHIAGLKIPLSVSIGVGSFHVGKHRNDDGFYGAVDVALYAAKKQGRNRVVSVSMLEAAGRDLPAPSGTPSNLRQDAEENPGHA